MFAYVFFAISFASAESGATTSLYPLAHSTSSQLVASWYGFAKTSLLRRIRHQRFRQAQQREEKRQHDLHPGAAAQDAACLEREVLAHERCELRAGAVFVAAPCAVVERSGQETSGGKGDAVRKRQN